MKSFFLPLVCMLAAVSTVWGQPAYVPPTFFRILYIDRPFTEDETKAISEGKLSSAAGIRFSSEVPGAKGKKSEIEFFVLRNQISQTLTYSGNGPLVLRLSTPANTIVASVPVPQDGGDLLIVLKPTKSGLLENATSLVIANGGKEFPPGNLCIVNVTGFRLAFETLQSNIIIGPDESRVFVPIKQRMNAVPLKISADVRPAPRLIFEGAVRLSATDRIMFVAYSPPGSTDVFKTDFFMLQPPIAPSAP